MLLTNVSFPATKSQSNILPRKDPDVSPPEKASSGPPASAYLLPSFDYVPTVPIDSNSVEAFIKAFVLPQKLHNTYDRLTREQKHVMLRKPELRSRFPGMRPVNEILVLICGHGGRDERCGKLGPMLKAEFEEKLERQNIRVLREVPVEEGKEDAIDEKLPSAKVGLISHIGGHKWAGNVICYIPPAYKENALAGKGIWYGRVAPEHVEGIVGKTVMDGKVIKELFRGGIDRSGEIISL